jgi:hypothetical protein
MNSVALRVGTADGFRRKVDREGCVVSGCGKKSRCVVQSTGYPTTRWTRAAMARSLSSLILSPLIAGAPPRQLESLCRFASIKGGKIVDVIPSTMARLQKTKVSFLVCLSNIYSWNYIDKRSPDASFAF